MKINVVQMVWFDATCLHALTSSFFDCDIDKFVLCDCCFVLTLQEVKYANVIVRILTLDYLLLGSALNRDKK